MDGTGRAIASLAAGIGALMLWAGAAFAAEGTGKGPSAAPQGAKGKGAADRSAQGAGAIAAWIPPGLSREERAAWADGRPPGWRSGGKEGWKGAGTPPGTAKSGALPKGPAGQNPPGWGQWSEIKRNAWQKALREILGRVRQKAKTIRGFSGDDLESALLSVEGAARKGVPIGNVARVVEEAMERGLRGRAIESATRALAYGVGREADFDSLGAFANEKIREGLTGDNLALAIYREISRRHEQALKAAREKKAPKGRKD